MKSRALVSSYALKRYKVRKSKVNEDTEPNMLKREFGNRRKYEVVVSDLTYVRVNNKWHYVCALLDLFNREIIGYSVGQRKDSKLVYDAFMSTNLPLNQINIFHRNYLISKNEEELASYL